MGVQQVHFLGLDQAAGHLQLSSFQSDAKGQGQDTGSCERAPCVVSAQTEDVGS